MGRETAVVDDEGAPRRERQAVAAPPGVLARIWRICDRKAWWSLAIVGWTAGLLGGALVLEYGFGLAPCALCLNQRLWVVLAGVVAGVGFAHNPRLPVYPLLAALASLGGAFFAVRHLHLLTLPEGAVPRCGVDFGYMLDAFPLAEVLTAMLSGTGECADQSATVPALALLGFVGTLALAGLQWRSPT